jgi:hypothetical protein
MVSRENCEHLAEAPLKMRKESGLRIEEPRAHSVPWTPIRWCERIRRSNLLALRLRRVTDFDRDERHWSSCASA